MAIKKYATLSTLSNFLDNLKNLFATKTEVSNKSDKTHTHTISDIANLQSTLNGKANSSHGTHVTYSTDNPVMDGAASAGSASTVSRSDHRHPTDSSRASQTSLDSHTGNTTNHITSTERANWNAAYTHSQASHAPSNAEPNQNAFSNVKVGDVTIAADIKTDTLTLVAGNNITITPDATNDKVTISSTDTNTTYSAGTGISLSGTTFSNSGVRSVSTGASNGTISVNTNGTTANVAVKGLGSAAYTASTAYDTAGSANNALASAKTYADNAATTAANNVKNDLLGGAGAAYDTLKELGELITDNQDAIDVLESVASSKANASDLASHTSNKSNPHGVTMAQLGIGSAGSSLGLVKSGGDVTISSGVITVNDDSHNHIISNIDNLQTTLDGKASSSHTHTVANITDLKATATELNYMDGVTSGVQTQLDGKASSNHNHGLLHTNFTKQLDNTTTDSGWSMINDSYSGFLLKSLRTQKDAPSWTQGNYSAGVAFGGADTKGVITHAYNSPSITFAGGNGDKPVWWIKATGTSGTTYNLNNMPLATKATQDGNGNNIVNTYATKTALDTKQATVTGAATTITGSNLTANRALISNGSGKVAVSAVTSTELGYLDGVTSNVQTQIDGKANTSHTHNYAGSSSAGGSATSAVKLQTARSIGLGNDFTGSANFDGSGNITISAKHYNISINSGNKSNYPYHRFAYRGSKASPIASQYNDTDAIFLIRKSYNGGGYGILKVSLRTNASTSTSQASATWLVRYNIALDDVKVGLYNVAGATYVDLYMKVGTYARTIVSQLEGNRSWTLVASNEVNDTTTTDAKTSIESYISIETAATTLHGQAYTSITSSVDGGQVNSADKATKDASGNTITSTYMTKSNPTGSGYLSINRKSGTTVGTNSVAIGYNGTATASYSYVEGDSNTASELDAHAEGRGTTASGKHSHSQGIGTTASGTGSHAEGTGTTASGMYCHAEGASTTAKGYQTHAEGSGTIAAGSDQHAQGRYNIEDTAYKYAHIVGNGDSTTRSNAHTLDWSGNGWFKGDVYVGGTSQSDGIKLVKSTDIISVAKGGTGATTAAAALQNLGLTATAAELNYTDGVTSNIQTQLNGKSSTSHTHTADNLVQWAEALFATASNGGVEYSYGSNSGKNVLTEISNMATGLHTIYSIAGTTGNPNTTESWRMLVHKTSVTIGWILAFDAQGSIYSNYQSAANSFKGWKCIYDAAPPILWMGEYWCTDTQTVTPSKALSACRNGWVLVWSDYDTANEKSSNGDCFTTVIPKWNPNHVKWSGQSFIAAIPTGLNDSGVITFAGKRLYVHDTKITGHTVNDVAPSNDVCLRAIYEY